jgi:hypothetical protein
MPFHSHPNIAEPAGNEKLWRYISFIKFFDLIDTAQIHLTRLDHLTNDPWEGLPPPKNYSPDLQVSVSTVKLSIGNKIETSTVKSEMSLKDFHGEKFEAELKRQKESDVKAKQTVFVNCWHRSPYETDAFWNFYSNANCIAISTTPDSIKKSINDSRILYLANIRYYDPETESIPDGNVLYAPTHKRQHFSHEKETRILYKDFENYKRTGRNPPLTNRLNVDLNILLQEVWLPPTADDLLKSSVTSLLKKKGIEAQIKSSSILSKPF